MHKALLFLSLSLPASVALASPTAQSTSLAADAATLNSPFKVEASTQVPGKSLKPGSYTITIKDHLSDRAILEVKNKDGRVEATFLGVNHAGLSSGAAGPIAVPTEKGERALRGFSFPGGSSIEFVYPKAEAAALADRTSAEVLAIDPASDNLHVTKGNLSKEDAEMVTLWSLQATRVTPTEKGITAKKWIAPSAPQEARNAAPATSPASASVASASKKPAPAQKQVAQNRLPSTMKALPHTATNAPLFLFLSTLGLCGAGLVRMRRERNSEA